MKASKIYSEDIQDEMRLQIMEDLEQIYSQARESGKLSIALKAKELQGKYI